jgi:dCTP deaminase
MILTDKDIKKALSSGLVKIKPKLNYKEQLGSCSVDLRLGKKFRIFNHSKFAYIDPRKKDFADEVTEEVVASDKYPFILQPGDFALATTIEWFSLPNNMLARLEGRSSLGRLGIVVHSTASIFEPGWRGVVVMELGNSGRMPVALYPGMRVCALTFEQLTGEVETPYYLKKTAKYVDQKDPIESKISLDK